MSQLATLRALDADMLAAFAGAGLADTGTYQSPDGDEVPITYLHDDDALSESGDAFARTSGQQPALSLFLGEFVGTGLLPVSRGQVIGDDGRTWRLAQQIAADDSMVRWLATPAPAEGV